MNPPNKIKYIYIKICEEGFRIETGRLNNKYVIKWYNLSLLEELDDSLIGYKEINTIMNKNIIVILIHFL